MKLSALKQLFQERLEASYPRTEWETFFYWLVEDRLGLDRLNIHTDPNRLLSTTDIAYFKGAVDRLATHEPVQYILGHTEFYGLRIAVNPHTLIPRPETESLVDWVKEDWAGKPGQLLDLGTGSGCIALALAHELPSMKVSAMDRSTEALKVARQNAQNLRLEVSFFEDDMRSFMTTTRFDVLVSNPPYVRELERGQMLPNVLEYEPESALFVPDADPLLYYRALAKLGHMLCEGGALYLEINEYLGKETVALLQEAGYRQVELRQDLHGKDRMIKARLDERP